MRKHFNSCSTHCGLCPLPRCRFGGQARPGRAVLAECADSLRTAAKLLYAQGILEAKLAPFMKKITRTNLLIRLIQFVASECPLHTTRVRACTCVCVSVSVFACAASLHIVVHRTRHAWSMDTLTACCNSLLCGCLRSGGLSPTLSTNVVCSTRWPNWYLLRWPCHQSLAHYFKHRLRRLVRLS